MLLFKCLNCQNLIQAEYENLGEMVECPLCKFVQIAPDPRLSPGSFMNDYRIIKVLESNLVWVSYLAQNNCKEPPCQVVVKVPTSFFVKRVSDFGRFSDCIIKYGSTQINELPSLIDRNLVKGRTFFAYKHIEHARSLSEFALGAPVRCEDALIIVKNIARALYELWEKDKGVHLNLNPETVLLIINRLDVRLLDCGLASFLVNETRLLDEGLNIWDTRYLSPEFNNAGISDSNLCDIYSLGCLLYFLFTGSHPSDLPESESTPYPILPEATAKKIESHHPALSLISSLMERDPGKRMSSYPEIINRIEGILNSMSPERRVLEFRKRFNIWGSYATHESRQAELSGFPAGRTEKKFHTRKKTDEMVVKTAAGRVVSPEKKFTPFNKNWKRHQDSSSSRQVVILAIVFVATLIFAIWMINLNRPSTSTVLEAVPEKTTEQVSPVEKEPSPVQEKNETPKEVEKPVPAAATFKSEKEEIEKYVAANPDDFDGAIRKYEDLKRPYVLKNNMGVVGDINDRIFDLEKKKERKIEETVHEIVNSLKTLLEKGDTKDAVIALDSYNGRFAVETKRQRAELSRKILDGASIIELQKGETIKMVDVIFEKNIGAVQNCDFKTIISGLDALLQKPQATIIRDIIVEIKSDIEVYAQMHQSLAQGGMTKKQLRKKVEDMDRDSHPLLRGLVFCELGDFQEGYQNFEKMPYGTGNHFITEFGEVEAKKALKDILDKYSIVFNPDSTEKFMESVSKKLNGNDAPKLLADLKLYESEFDDTVFLNKNINIVETLKKYCFNLLNDKQKAGEREIIISGKEGLPPGQELCNVLEKADNFTTIFLKKGVYRLGSGTQNQKNSSQEKLEQSSIGRGEFRLSLTGLKLIGEEGVVFEDSLTITAQAVEISNIRINKGKFSIVPNTISVLPDSGGITVKNCIFNDEETMVVRGSKIIFDSCFMKGMIVEKCNSVLLNHCTIISQVRGLSQNAALWIDGGNLNITDCIVYGKYFAIVFSDKGSNIKRTKEIVTNRAITISGSLVYGEQGISVFQFENRTMEEDDIVKNSGKMSRYCRSKKNIFYAPLFVNLEKEDWRLVKGSPGYKGGAPGYKGGAICYNNSREKKDCGVIWPEK